MKDSLDNTVRFLFAHTGMPGMTAAILVPGQGMWHTDTGFISKPANKRVDNTTVFYWASVTKLITASIISQLIEEHKLTVDNKLVNWFPQIENANDITIANLLEQTSGIYSFNNDSKIFDINHYYSPNQLLKLAASRKNLFRPGQYWSYSNTNYLLLALIAEKIEGRKFARIVQERIATPMHLTSLHILEENTPAADLALAHANGQIVKEDYSVPLGAGDVLSNANDMVMLLYYLMTTKPGLYNRLKDLYPMPDKGIYYGNGIMLTDFSEITGSNDIWIGHSGGTETYRALLVYDTAKKAFIAISVNAHISVEACAMKLLGQIGL
ncbi:MAG: serine hydrolase [Flavipsychrobacter sp.]|nr:serine hydrolase [Flavipsychrobacter sp.]